ncbi:MAG: GTP-binding protein [Candidatus Heimdallarchaeota archaeon]|nr:GTP-binding protein [Candidatus Heimdallarchaeota archaeon]
MTKFLFKIVLIGDGAVGKTSIRRRYMGEGFKTDFLATMGADFAYLKTKIDDYNIEWSIWDLAGQQAFRGVMKSYYKGAMGALAVYDVTQTKTLDSLDSWVSEVRERAGTFSDLPVVLVGNKIDLRPEIPSSLKTLQGFVKSKSLNADFVETSAKTGEAIEEAFTKLARKIIPYIK